MRVEEPEGSKESQNSTKVSAVYTVSEKHLY